MLHVSAYFLVSIVIVVAQAELASSVTTQSMQFLICYDFASKTNDFERTKLTSVGTHTEAQMDALFCALCLNVLEQQAIVS